jgi:quinol monooxygenase YgiN
MTANIMTRLVIKPEKLSEALDYLRAMKADVHANEPFAAFYQSYYFKERPNEIIVVEIFEDESGKEAHLARHAWRRDDFLSFLAEPEVLREAIQL